jgi:DNA-directed RNA polymerase alpha subunit
MTDLQLYLAVGLPTLAVMSSLIISLFQISGVRDDIREIRGDIKAINGKLADMDVEIGRLMDKSG